jgi:hypothetical protein
MENLSLEYIAGLIDADGSISISISKNRYVNKKGNSEPQFAFVMNLRFIPKHREVLEAVQQTLGVGKIYEHKAYSATSSAMLSWQTTTHFDTLWACTKLLPHLHLKKNEATLMIEALTAWLAFESRRKSPELKEHIIEIANQMNTGQQKDTSRRNKDLREVSPAFIDPSITEWKATGEFPATDFSSIKHSCDIPPEGWFCTRLYGHEGPCAAYPEWANERK